MNTEKPLVSIIMPVWNSENYVFDAISSICMQSFRDFEFIIIDDGSTDGTTKIIQDLSKTDQRIRFFVNEKNIGLSRSLNKGIQLANGVYLARMDADDVSLPGRLASQVKFLEDFPNVGVLGSYVRIISNNGQLGKIIKYPTNSMIIKWELLFRNTFAHPSVMMRRELFNKISGYDENLLAAQDRDLWLKLRETTVFSNLPEPFILYRIHNPNNITNRKKEVQMDNSIRLCQGAFSRCLGFEVPFEVCQDIFLQKSKNPKRALAAGKIINLLQKAFVVDEELSKSEQKKIRKLANKKKNKIFSPWLKELMFDREFQNFIFSSNEDFLLFLLFRNIKKIIKHNVYS